MGGRGWGGGVSEPPSMERPPQRLSRFRWRTSSWMSEVRAWWHWLEDASSMGTPHPWRHPIFGPHMVSCPTGHLKLTDFGLSRHLQWGERAHTICGTLQYMAPEVLSGGPYSHAADWWSLGVLLFALASGEFPVAPAGDHVAMLERVKQSSYESPPAFSPALARLMAELLCHNPLHRLRYLHHFQGHPFFRGVAFDADLLQKDPVAVAVAPQPPEQPPPDPATFDDFDCDLEVPSTAPSGRPWPG
uniref:Ribosomal protein S6 kinase related n=2 Tax=Strigops habroptila TaxID=2489341 RepID=A0A672TW65_STRHB